MPTTAADKLTAKGRATRGRIVTAAAELMSQHGVARTTIEDIQEAAAVSTSQMYHYFADKGDLVAAVIDFQTDRSWRCNISVSTTLKASKTYTGGAKSWSTWCAVWAA